MNLLFYHVVHIFGVICLFLGLGGLGAIALVEASDEAKKRARGVLTALHGVGLLLLLVGGFGALAKLNMGFPLWVMVKVSLWVLFGASVVLFKRAPALGKVWLMVLPALGLVAAYLGVYKPF